MKKELKERCYKELAENLPVLRAKLSLSQEGLAELLDISRQTLSSIETSKSFNKWSLFLATMFIFDYNPKTRNILRGLNIPYKELHDTMNIEDGLFEVES